MEKRRFGPLAAWKPHVEATQETYPLHASPIVERATSNALEGCPEDSAAGAREPVVNGERGGLQPRMNLELRKDVLDVRPHSVRRQMELPGDVVA
jgi:hypothetical protein